MLHVGSKKPFSVLLHFLGFNVRFDGFTPMALYLCTLYVLESACVSSLGQSGDRIRQELRASRRSRGDKKSEEILGSREGSPKSRVRVAEAKKSKPSTEGKCDVEIARDRNMARAKSVGWRANAKPLARGSVCNKVY